jgi:hypothetical protein
VESAKAQTDLKFSCFQLPHARPVAQFGSNPRLRDSQADDWRDGVDVPAMRLKVAIYPLELCRRGNHDLIQRENRVTFGADPDKWDICVIDKGLAD